jgi:hypothetical protein
MLHILQVFVCIIFKIWFWVRLGWWILKLIKLQQNTNVKDVQVIYYRSLLIFKSE